MTKIVKKEAFHVLNTVFSSAKFDIDIFIRNICTHKWRVKFITEPSSIRKVVAVELLNNGKRRS